MRQVLQIAAVALFAAFLGCGQQSTPAPTSGPLVPDPQPVVFHPVFETTLTGKARNRPAIQVDIHDDSEDIFFTAELYLSVESSRFPNETRILLPLNSGPLAGNRKLFVQLPFEVEPAETLAFNLLDNDRLTSQQEEKIMEGCRTTGYCVVIAGEVFCPPAARIASPGALVAAEILGQAVVQDVRLHAFENFGTAEYIVPAELPDHPHQANELSIRSGKNYVPVVLKVYGDPSEHVTPFDAGSA